MVKEEVRVSQVVVMEIGGTSTPDVEVVAMSRSMKVVRVGLQEQKIIPMAMRSLKETIKVVIISKGTTEIVILIGEEVDSMLDPALTGITQVHFPIEATPTIVGLMRGVETTAMSRGMVVHLIMVVTMVVRAEAGMLILLRCRSRLCKMHQRPSQRSWLNFLVSKHALDLFRPTLRRKEHCQTGLWRRLGNLGQHGTTAEFCDFSAAAAVCAHFFSAA
jgi:hypothetical protein